MEANTSLSLNLTKLEFISNNGKNVEFFNHMLKSIIFMVSAFFTTILNFILILSWLIQKNKKNYADLILISMALSDLINGLYVLPLFAFKELNSLNTTNNELNRFLIHTVNIIDMTTSEITIISLLILSLHRYRQLVVPFKEKSLLNRNKISLLISIWVFSLMYWFVTFWPFRPLVFEKNKLIRFITMIIGIYIPILIVIVLNILIKKTFKLKINQNQLNKMCFKRERRAIACTNSITICLVVTCLSYLIIFPFDVLNFEFVRYLFGFHYIIYFHAALNPLVVFRFNKKFRLFSRKIYEN